MSNGGDEFRAQIIEALRRLEAGLQQSVAIKEQRASAGESLGAVVEFINSLEWMQRQGLAAPLQNLRWALNDLNAGIVAPMLTIPPGERKSGHSTSRKLTQALAIFCSDLLLDDRLSVQEACRFVVLEFKKIGLEVEGKRGAPAWKTVKTWRDEVKRQDPYIKDIVKTLRACRDPARVRGLAKQAVREVIADVGPKIGRFGKLD